MAIRYKFVITTTPFVVLSLFEHSLLHAKQKESS